MKLFSENLGIAKDDKGLIALREKFPDYDGSYLCQAAAISRREEKEWMEKLWQQYELYADSHFLNDFKRQFMQRSWELYMGATLLNRGFKLGRHTNLGPDFDLQDSQGKRLAWIEAVAAEQGSGNDRVPDIIYNIVQNVPEEQMLLRIANALDQKFIKYQTELARGVVSAGEPYVIAVNRSGTGHPDPDIPLILKNLFGIGHQSLRIMVNGVRQEKPDSFWSGRPKVEKQSGGSVSMLFFEDVKHSGISAVVYCKDSILSSPHLSQEMGENLVIVHNPLAKNPLPDMFFPFGDEYRAIGEHIIKNKNGNKI